MEDIKKIISDVNKKLSRYKDDSPVDDILSDYGFEELHNDNEGNIWLTHNKVDGYFSLNSDWSSMSGPFKKAASKSSGGDGGRRNESLIGRIDDILESAQARKGLSLAMTKDLSDVSADLLTLLKKVDKGVKDRMKDEPSWGQIGELQAIREKLKELEATMGL